MATLTIDVPDDVKDYVEENVGVEYPDSGSYVTDLIRKDRDRRLEELRAIVEEARAGGISPLTLDEIFDAAVARARERGTLRD